MKTRLHQFLSKTGLFKSKQNVFEAIRKGEIQVDGRIINLPSFQFSDHKIVTWKGKPLGRVEQRMYILLNKPEGFLASRLAQEDIRRNKRSVFELLENDQRMDDSLLKTLFCVGRLDEDSCGLLILTNDGFLSTQITNPDNHVPKTYSVMLETPLSAQDTLHIEQGVVIELEENGKITKYKTKPSKIVKGERPSEARLTLDEGKKREVRRIFDALGNKVTMLERISIGDIKLSELHLAKGQYRVVNKEFILQRLPRAVGIQAAGAKQKH